MVKRGAPGLASSCAQVALRRQLSSEDATTHRHQGEGLCTKLPSMPIPWKPMVWGWGCGQRSHTRPSYRNDQAAPNSCSSHYCHLWTRGDLTGACGDRGVDCLNLHRTGEETNCRAASTPKLLWLGGVGEGKGRTLARQPDCMDLCTPASPRPFLAGPPFTSLCAPRSSKELWAAGSFRVNRHTPLLALSYPHRHPSAGSQWLWDSETIPEYLARADSCPKYCSSIHPVDRDLSGLLSLGCKPRAMT